jgi:hypothetical protein
VGADMNKQQAFHAFLSRFGWKAYDETSVPDYAQLPYITYEMPDDFFDYTIASTVSLWTRSSSQAEITEKSNEIAVAIGRGIVVHYDGGVIIIHRGNPWAQRMTDTSDDMIRRIVLNITVEYVE